MGFFGGTLDISFLLLIEKKFVLPDIKTKKYSATLKCNFYWQIPGSATININGQLFKFRADKTGFKPQEFVLKDIADGEIVIMPVKLDCSLFCFIDVQRDYGRTIINHENSGGELVSSLYIEDKEDEN